MDIFDFAAFGSRFDRGGTGDTSMAWKSNIAFGISYDHTVLFRAVVLPRRRAEVRFGACDFESEDCRMDGKRTVVFSSGGKETRAIAPMLPFSGFSSLWERLIEKEPVSILLPRKPIVDFIDRGLPHVEILFSSSDVKVIQRDFYSGKIMSMDIEVNPAVLENLSDSVSIALKTEELLIVLDTLRNLEQIDAKIFVEKDEEIKGDYKFGYCYLRGGDLEILLGGCLFDTLGSLAMP